MARVKHVFQRMNKDASPLALKPGEVREMLNVHVFPTFVANVPATVSILPAQVAGEKVIGSYEDKQHDQIIGFIFSDTGAHRIVKYQPGDASTATVLQWSGFGWTADTNITGIGVIDDLLFWCDGGPEIRQINMARKALYDSIKATDPYFANLIKRPPLLAPDVSKLTATASTDPNYIREDFFQFTSRYIYQDEEVSVFGPYSEVISYEYKGANDTTKRKIAVSLPAGINTNALIKRVEFAVKRGSQDGLYIIKSFDLPSVESSALAFEFDNSAMGIVVPTDDAVRLFDAVPLSPASITIARNRLFAANFLDGYDGFGEATMALSLVATPFVYGNPVWKGRSQVQFGIEYVDYAGRSIGVYHKPEWSINIPELNHNSITNQPSAIKIEASITKPDWAAAWNLVRKKTSNYLFYLQGYGTFIFKQEADEKIITMQEPARIMEGGTPSGLYPLKELFINVEGLATRNIGYVYEAGDKVNIYYTWKGQGGDPFEYRVIYDVPIIEQQGGFLKIPFGTIATNEPIEYVNGIFFEIFRNNISTDTDEYFRTGEGGILSAGTTSVTIDLPGDSFLIQNTQKNPKTYTKFDTGTTTGSVVYDDADIVVFFPFVEAMSPWDRFYSHWPQSLGQSLAILPKHLQKQVSKPNFERFSNKYLSGTQINGLNSFEALNEKELPMENGPINKLQLASNNQAQGSVLLAIMQNETETQYLGEVQWRDTQGRTTSAISDAVIGSTNTLRGGFGTINPESVVQEGGRVWFWDATKGEPVRYSADGLTPLATDYDMRDFFRDVSRRQLALGNQVKVYGGFDPQMKEYIMTFSEVKDGDDVLFEGFTIAFADGEKFKGFSTFYSFRPERYVKCNTHFYSFLAGAMHQHHLGETTNEFYGTHYPSSIRFVSNAEPSLVKVWHSVIIEGQKLWVPVELVNEMGQASLMKANWFEDREGIFYGAIRRDKNSTGFKAYTDPVEKEIRAINNGQPMRSQYLEIEIENNTTSVVRLDAASVEFIPSSGHTP